MLDFLKNVLFFVNTGIYVIETAHQGEPVLKLSARYVKQWLTYTFGFWYTGVWKNASNLYAYCMMFRTSHNKKGRLWHSELKL